MGKISLFVNGKEIIGEAWEVASIRQLERFDLPEFVAIMQPTHHTLKVDGESDRNFRSLNFSEIDGKNVVNLSDEII